MLTLFLGITVSTWALLRERVARKQANQQLYAATSFVGEVLHRVAPAIANLAGAAEAQEMLGQAGLDFVQRLRASAGDNPSLRVALARLLLHMSQMQNPGNANTVGDYEAGLKRAEEAHHLHWQLSLDLNQSAQSREHHKAEARKAAGVILELSDE
jgi:hypothetical protein